MTTIPSEPQKEEGIGTAVYNPWRESLLNCMTGDNYLRATEWQQLIDLTDEFYALQAIAAPREGWVPSDAAYPDMDGDAVPAIGSKWSHSNGDTYTVTGYADMFSQSHAKRPPRVIYRSAKTGRVWSRPLSDWYENHAAIPAAPLAVEATEK